MAYNDEINRLICAAIVNEKFRRKLLNDPQAAIEEGYEGESFALTESEKNHLLLIKAKDLQDFTRQLLDGNVY